MDQTLSVFLAVARRSLLLSLCLAWAAWPSFAPAEEAAAAKGKAQTFLGPVAGAPDGTLMAIVIDRGNVMAYICSRDDKFNVQHSRWFRGTCSEAGDVSAKSKDGVKLAGKRDGETLTATVARSDEALKASLSLEEPGSDAGLWRAQAKVSDCDIVVGWIVNRGNGPIQDRFRGRLTCARQGSPRSIQGLTLGSKNCKLKKANQLAINAQAVVEEVQEEIAVEGQQIQEVEAIQEPVQEVAPESAKKKEPAKAAKKQ
jgi:hypothetical protein